MADSKSFILYDISSSIEPRTYAPNPSKARLALNFKRVPFKITWVDILDIPEVRKGLGCAPVRKFDDGSDYYTLPVLQDPNTGKVIGDSFDIADYLESTYPDSGGCLFPSDSTGTGLDYESPNKDTPFYAPLTSNRETKWSAYAKFNVHVDATFSANIGLLGQFLPFHPKTAEEAKALFAKRAHLNSWDDLCFEGEVREQIKAGMKEGLRTLAECFMVHPNGPYLEGEKANYADLIVGGWLNMISLTMPEDEWKEFRTWYGGAFARLHDAMQKDYMR